MDKNESEISGPLGDGTWTIRREGRFVDALAAYEGGGSTHACTVMEKQAQHLRDFARNLERAADYLEGK